MHRGDIGLSARINVEALLWATGLTRGEDRKFLGLGPQFAAPREDAIRQAMVDCFSSRYPPYQFGDGEPITCRLDGRHDHVAAQAGGRHRTSQRDR